MFNQLIESIRNVVEGEGSVMQLDRGTRMGSSGNKFGKKQRSKMRRADVRLKIRKGEPEKIRRDVIAGKAS